MTGRLLAGAGLAVVLAALFVLARDGVQAPSQFAPATPFRLEDIDGGSVDLESHRGQVVLVNFWATYCLPCVEEMPSLERLWREGRDRGLVVVGISIDDEPGVVKRFRGQHRLSFPVAHDAGKLVASRYGTDKVPETYVISRSGELRAKVVGAVDWMAPPQRSLVETLLGERS